MQVEFLEYLYSQYPFFGLKTCTTYTQTYVKDLHTVGRPILEFAGRYRVPILFHSAYDKSDPWASLDDIISIIEGNPDITFCIAHTARFLKKALDIAKRLPNCFVDLSAFKIHCDLAVENNIVIPPPNERFPADYTCPVDAMRKIIETYPDTIIWGSDAPAYYFIQKYKDANGEIRECDLRCDYHTEVDNLRMLPKELIKKVAFDNVIRFLECSDSSC